MGRPKGLPKTGGRKPGTPNRTTAATRERIEGDADPVGFMISVMHGQAIGGQLPTLDHRLQIASRLLDKIVPDIKASSVPGPDRNRAAVLEHPAPEHAIVRLARRLERISKHGASTPEATEQLGQHSATDADNRP